MRKFIFLLFFLIITMLLNCQDMRKTDSGWMPEILEKDSGKTVYLPDFSYAGYHWGEDSLPNFSGNVDVRDYGAIPDDGKDDSDAILKALTAANALPNTAVVKFPPGKFILKKHLFIERSNFVLQGAGSGETGTTLYMPLPMKDMPLPEGMVELNEYLVKNDKRVKSGELFSPFSWTGGIIWPRVKGKRIYPYLPELDQAAAVLAEISGGKRGEYQFTVNNTAGLNSGDLLKILWYNHDGAAGSFLKHLYGEGEFKIGARHWENPQRPLVQQIVTITGIKDNIVSIKTPLLHDVKAEWQSVLSPAEVLTEIGIEHLRIEFPEVPYGGHHLEHGYNAIYLTSVAHAWVRNVHFVTSDNGILSDDCANITIEDVTFGGRTAHYTTHLGKVNHALVKNSIVDCPSEHALSFNSFCKASVYSNVDILQTPSLDQHCGTNHQNLFDNIRITVAERQPDLFKHGGAGYWKPTHGRYNTFWNIDLNFTFQAHSEDTVMIKGINDGPEARLVGFNGNYPLKFEYGPNAYFEGMNQPSIAIPSLYEYQLEKRLKQ